MVNALAGMMLGLLLACGGTFLCYSMVNAALAQHRPRLKRLGAQLELAQIEQPIDRAAAAVFAAGSLIWIVLVLLLHWGLLQEIVTMPLIVGAAFAAANFVLKRKAGKQQDQFMDQLEMALRLMSGGVRIGLSLPQAMTHITEEMSDPARREFKRVVGQTRIGASTADALDALSERMPGSETLMLARVIRVQAQTGGSLSLILDHLAETIKERRYIQRKISALTAEGRIGALVLEALPVGVGLFVTVVERPMGQALLGTMVGHAVLIWAAFLEVTAIMVLNNMLKVNV